MIQFATDSIHDESKTLKEKFVQSEFLKDFRHVVQQNTRGCIILERPDLLEDLVKKHGAKDSTFRKQAMQELQNLETRTSQYSPGNEVPEKSWVYRIAKKFFPIDIFLVTQFMVKCIIPDPGTKFCIPVRINLDHTDISKYTFPV